MYKLVQNHKTVFGSHAYLQFRPIELRMVRSFSEISNSNSMFSLMCDGFKDFGRIPKN